MADYCQVCFSWTTEGDFHDVIDYGIQQTEQTDSDRDFDSSVNAHLPVLRGKLQLSSEPKDGETSHLCTLKLKCKPIYKVAIKGIDIVSEAKTLEIYDDIDGYLQSVKGVPIPGCEDGHVFYISSFQIREPARNMEIKFLSLGEKLSFEVHRIRITLVEHSAQPDRSKLDLVRLKNHIAGLGSLVSDNARSLFETMEQYHKNQQGVLGDVQNLLSQTSTSTGKQSALPGFAGLLGTFSQLKQQQKNPLVEIALDGTSKEDQEGDEKSDPSKLADNMLSSMMAGVDSGHAVQSDDMYRFLHSVCGRVTKMREKTVQENREQDDLTNSASLHEETTPATLDRAVLTEVLSELKASEERIVRLVEKQMVQLEEKLNRKLDRILEALQVTVSTSPCVQLSTSNHMDDGVQLSTSNHMDDGIQLSTSNHMDDGVQLD